ncbi:MAG TPA: Rossmann-like and DUF2520 domain-containing protein [Verrucomicrobiae bacterium]|jgi:predicted short-subunit dehydrogenase-like oxidoreductase (DUF2520 family)|nr:Rossmann-like and DUF2520 domain-containing protein [Verrucomicrobiae bacterium]
MAASQHRRASITLVGAGNLASVLGPALKSAGYKIDAVVSRPLPKSRRRAAALARKLGAGTVVLERSELESDVVWLCHTDDALVETAARLARHSAWRGRIVFHSSGALTSDVLSPLRSAGAHVASFHPMMTFVPGTSPSMAGITFAVEGDRKAVSAAREIAGALQAEIFVIKKDAKVLYHALGSFSSPLLVAALATAERVGRAAGLSASRTRKVVGPILWQTLNNYLNNGAAAAYGGPMKRGDLDTVRRHLKQLRRVEGAGEVYRALVQSALTDLPANNKAALRRLLQEMK